MRKLFGLLLILVLVAGIASAETGPGKGKMTLGPTITPELPIGDYADVAGFGVGVGARFQFGLQENIALTGDFGWTWHGKKNEATTTTVPLLFGGKYGISPGWFASAQLGLYFVSFDVPDVDVPGLGTIEAATETRFVLAPGIGYERGPWEGLLRFVVIDSDVMNVGITVAYNFSVGK